VQLISVGKFNPQNKEEKMHRFLSAVMLLVLAAATVLAQDPVKADPKHFKVEFENDQVRVLRFHGDPHGKVPMHEHSVARVTVSLTDEHDKTTSPDGKVTETRRKAGEVAWGDPGKHTSENLSDKPYDQIQVELKGKPGAKSVALTLDPVKMDPKHYKVELENDRVRILRVHQDAHSKQPMHEHMARVNVNLTNSHTKNTAADGKIQETNRKAGEVSWSDAVKHTSENLGESFDQISIELK
jgi:hypothetical protein